MKKAYKHNLAYLNQYIILRCCPKQSSFHGTYDSVFLFRLDVIMNTDIQAFRYVSIML